MFERSKYFSAGEVCKRLHWHQSRLNRAIANNEFPAVKLINGRRWFPREITERRIAELQGRTLSDGEIDALACKLIREGHSDGAIVMQLRLPIDHVIKLRRSLGLPTLTDVPPPSPPRPPSARAPRIAGLPSSTEPSGNDDFWTALAKASAARRKKNA